MIAVECACGKRAKVKDELAGRKIKCPECKEPIVVPGERVATADDDAAAPTGKAAFAGLPRKEKTPAAGIPRKTPAGGVPRAQAVGGAVGDDDEAPRKKGAFAGLPRKKGGDDDAASDEKPCPFCAEPVKRAAKKCRHCGESLVDGAKEGRKRDVDHERHIRAIAVWFRIGGLLIGLAALAMGGLGLVGGGRGGARAAGLIVGMSSVFLGFAAGYYAIGHFLWGYSGGARIAFLVLSALGVGLNLLGLVVGGMKFGDLLGAGIQLGYTGAMMWAVGGAQGAAICTPEYQALVERTPDVKVPFWTSPFFWIPVALMGLMLVVGIVAATRF